MISWLYPANPKFYDVFEALRKKKTYWPMNSKAESGDVIYFYLAAPHKQLGFVCQVGEVNLAEELVLESLRPFFKEPAADKGGKKQKLFMEVKPDFEIPLESDSLLGLDYLREKGLKGMLMGPRKLDNNPELLNYIRKCLPKVS